MIGIQFEEPQGEDWIRWRVDCGEAQTRANMAVKRGEGFVITDLYKRRKQPYVAPDGPFGGKCAYCESNIAADQPGDIEHFRPKGKVTDANNAVVMIRSDDGEEKPHPGYYWLAYDWRNLLPSCRDCNSPSRAKTGVLIGKGTRFPVADFRAQRPGEEEREHALLIHPVIEDPAEHLDIDATGVFSVRNGSAKGTATTDVLGLNLRGALVDARKAAYEDTRRALTLLPMSLTHGTRAEAMHLLESLSEVVNGKAPFAAARRAALSDGKTRLRPLIEFLGGVV